MEVNNSEHNQSAELIRINYLEYKLEEYVKNMHKRMDNMEAVMPDKKIPICSKCEGKGRTWR